jgi:hypothetical protein
VQDLVHDGGGQRLDGRPLLGRGLRQPPQRPLHLGEPDLLQPRAQRHDGGDHLDVALAQEELADLPLDERLGALGLARALTQVGVDHLLEIVDVVAVDVVEPVHARLHVARNRDVDEEQGPPATPVHDPRDRGPGDHRLGRAGRRHHDVHAGQRGLELFPRYRRAAQGPGQILGPRPGAVGHVDGKRPLLDQVLGRQLAHLAGPDQEHRAAGQAGEDLLGELDGGE